jgi:alpha-glucosidase (family GH31 glycosyl hydrolase)
MVKFDGIWEDMNEASNFCSGACYPEQKAADSALSKALYVPTGRDLNEKSIDIDAYHANNFTEFDMHSLFGTMEVKATHEWFQQQGRRTMIIERSAFAGMGKFGSRWLGDNASNEFLMGASVTGIMMHNIVGIPLAGSDICGFGGNTTAELCARWHIVGAFYPFSRNHNSWDTVAQEPWAFKNDFYNSSTTYMDIMRRGVQVKYHMTRYYYT